jgi:hypothetical protein
VRCASLLGKLLRRRNHLTTISREALDRSFTSLPNRSVTRSPTGSISTIGSINSSPGMRSGSGSKSTVFVLSLDSIVDIDDLQFAAGSSTRFAFFVHLCLLQFNTRAADDATKAVCTPEIRS